MGDYNFTKYNGEKIVAYIDDINEWVEGTLIRFDIHTYYFEEKGEPIYMTAMVKPDSDKFDLDDLQHWFSEIPVENIRLASY